MVGSNQTTVDHAKNGWNEQVIRRLRRAPLPSSAGRSFGTYTTILQLRQRFEFLREVPAVQPTRII